MPPVQLQKCSVIHSLWEEINSRFFMLGDNGIKHRSIARDLGLEVEEHLRWTEPVETRIGEAMRSWYLIKRNTSPIIT